MRKRSFTAHSWLSSSHPKGGHNLTSKKDLIEQSYSSNKLPEFSPRGNFSPVSSNIEFQKKPFLNFLNTHSLKDSLPSKCTYTLGKTIKILTQDVLDKLKSTPMFPEKLLVKFYEDFLSYCERKAIHIPLDDHKKFWIEFRSLQSQKSSVFAQDIEEFFEEYATKTSIFYLAKLRLIKSLNDQDDEKVNEFEILSPHNLFMKYFKKNSSLQLEGSFLLSNHYSWYVPSKLYTKPLKEFFDQASSITFSDFYYVLSSKVKYLQNISTDLSHRNFGLLVNTLLHNYFIWKNKKDVQVNDDENHNLEILSCRFMGDRVFELSLSHWLAQYNNSDFKWNILLSPRFHDSKSDHEVFFKLINEIEYYTFLSKISVFYDKTPFSFISQCSKQFKYNRKEAYWQEKDILSQNVNEVNSKFDKLVVFMKEKPLKNSHHFALQQVVESSVHLKDNGHIVFLSTQNLFVHSQRKRMKTFLKKFSIESAFDFSGLKSRGEVPPYIYIISKKDNNAQTEKLEREECFHFRFTGELSDFQEISSISDHMNTFFNDSFERIPNFYRKELSDKNAFEFFQEIIIDGQLIQSSNSDTGQITHPKFFKNMMSNCIPLNHFFEIQTLDIENFSRGKSDYSFQMDFTQDLLQQNKSMRGKDFALILNYNDPTNVFLEICTIDVLEAKSYDYGLTSCYYYYLIPKSLHININLFREYFFSSLGRQITQMSFSGTYHQAKSKISGLLVPKFFGQVSDMPSHLYDATSFMLNTEESILSANLLKLKEMNSTSQRILDQVFSEGYMYPVMTYLSYFKSTLYNCLKKNKRSKRSVKKFDFNNERVKKLLVNLNKRKIYPNNKDIFIEMHSQDMNGLSQELTDVIGHFNGREVIIELYSDDHKQVSIHTGLYSGAFLNFILPYTKNSKIVDVLKNLEIPSDRDLETLIEDHLGKFRILDELFKSVSSQVDSFLLRSMNSLK